MTLLAGCGDEAGGAADDELPVMRVVAGSAGAGETEYQFEVPEEVRAGPMRLALSNEGQEPRHTQVFRLDEGATMADLEAALARGEPARRWRSGRSLAARDWSRPVWSSHVDAVLDLERPATTR